MIGNNSSICCCNLGWCQGRGWQDDCACRDARHQKGGCQGLSSWRCPFHPRCSEGGMDLMTLDFLIFSFSLFPFPVSQFGIDHRRRSRMTKTESGTASRGTRAPLRGTFAFPEVHYSPPTKETHTHTKSNPKPKPKPIPKPNPNPHPNPNVM